MSDELVLGTRGSPLALAQSGQFAARLTAATGVPVRLSVIRTRGDEVVDRSLAEIGGKGLFTAELEMALRTGAIDLAVHSLKDLPTDDPEGLVIGAVPEREDPRDALVGVGLAALPPGAKVGTGSLRRRFQLLCLRPDLAVADIRGNIDTRLRRRDEGRYDCIVLAMAGLRRLGVDRADIHPLDPTLMIPAVGQGALGVQVRRGDDRVLHLVAALHHPATARCVAAERAFLRAYGGGCNVPVGAHATIDGDGLILRATIEDARGVTVAESKGSDAEHIGTDLARQMRG
jgi:hydroxymethylbilane synthase